MISLEEIDRAILEHEDKDTTYANCEKLAWLYVVRDHIAKDGKKVISDETITVSGDSEFMKRINGKRYLDVVALMDEAMSTMKVISPRLYDAVMNKL